MGMGGQEEERGEKKGKELEEGKKVNEEGEGEREIRKGRVGK